MNTAPRHHNNDHTISVLTGADSAHSRTLAAPKAARWLALGALVGPILFTAAWAVLGFLSPGYSAWGTWIGPYSPIHQGISGLGLGVTAPYMNTAFVVGGFIVMVGAIGIFQSIREIGGVARWSCTVLLALSGLGMALDGIFTLESFLPHMAGFLLAAGSPVLSFVVIGLWLRRVPSFRRFGNWLLLGSPLTLVLLVLYFMTFSPTVAGTQTGVAGLTERILVVEVFAWVVALGWLAFRRS
ncbi:MAG TPA: DUF998 domain-containing protein [Ktedonobacterales bacterium]